MSNERTQTKGRLQVSPLTGTIGAELSGVDVSGDLDAETVAAIRRALLENKVVFFRDQTLDYDGQVAFARRFGSLTLGTPRSSHHPTSRSSRRSTQPRVRPPPTGTPTSHSSISPSRSRSCAAW
jgi:taurine dioxygenase